MSQEESLARPPEDEYETVTPRFDSRPDGEMDSVGWLMFGLLAVLIIPLLPFIAIVYVLSKAFGYLDAQRGAGE